MIIKLMNDEEKIWCLKLKKSEWDSVEFDDII